MRDKARVAYESKLLLQARWAPVTNCVLFVRATPTGAVEALRDGPRGQYVFETTGARLRSQSVAASSLEGLFEALLPLEGPIGRRQMFVPTGNPDWSAMFTSDWRGQDAQSPMRWFANVGIESAAISDTVHAPDADGYRASYGQRKIEMYEIGADGTPVPKTLGVRAANKRTWEVAGGEVEFAVGNVWEPTATRVSNRFTHEHLAEMAARLELRPFDEDFYLPANEAVLLERTDLMAGEWMFASLAQARGEDALPRTVLIC